MSTATVSVIIPAYNAQATVAKAIQSALAQTHPPLEILVVDDGSADGTAEVVERFGPPVRLIRKSNGGPASARNLGARSAKGEWLALLDADDWWLPHKTATQLALTDNPKVGMVYSLELEAGRTIPDSISFEELWVKNVIFNSSVLLRRAVFEELGGFNEDRELISVEDYHFWLRVAASGWHIRGCPQELAYYAKGTGISSHSERLLRATVRNINLIGEQFRLPAPVLERRLLEVYESFGLIAVHERNMSLARTLLRRALATKPSLRRLVLYLGAFTPVSVLNLRRRLWAG